MTDTLDAAAAPLDRTSAEPEAPPFSQRASDRSYRVIVALAMILPPLGCVLVVLGHHHAAGLSEPDNLQFALHWAGLLSVFLPLAGLACARKTGGVTRALTIAGIGLFGMFGRFLNNRPVGVDEYIHLRQSIEALSNGEVGHPVSVLPITEEFFGLHQVASAFARLADLPLWTAGVTVITLAHTLSVLAVYQLIRMVGAPAPGAAAGAVLYTLNPSWLYFNVAFSYESLALPLVLWTLAASVAAGRATGRPSFRALAAAMVATAALPAIHHLSTIMLLLILTLLILARLMAWLPRVAVAGLRASHPDRLWPLVTIWYWLALSIQFWWSENYGWLANYLGPALSEGFSQLSHIVQKIVDGVSQPASGQRRLFANAANPIYEIIAGYLFPFVVLAVFLWATNVMWRNRHRFGSAPWAFAVVGFMFFASMPMLLTTGGGEGAHRSWGYSFVGIAVVCGVAWSLAPQSAGVVANRLPAVSKAVRRPAVRIFVALCTFTVLAFGSAALGINVPHRFPGTANVGDDARSMSYEARAVAEYLAAHAPPDTPVLADRYVTSELLSVGRMSPLSPSEEFPIYELYMSDAPIRPQVLKQIWDSEIEYFVVDSRMATTRPRMGYWFVRNEPGVGGTDLSPQLALDRFDCLPWLQAVYGAGPLTLYKVDRDTLAGTRAMSCVEATP
ncbi:hypothetical protein AWC12_07220 [Mycolicibacterium iranicum]|uniref:Glycosyltransferase RgtA/B/C/D-like domain-containing protein n=1 Tax=Mycolicibacterium iranicum TaxID=912594 RepID=A0A1X1WVH3_MYCIR|nr:hypothetical protein AWC12_07220 [Mycolicibacterium iranicum]